MAEGAASPSLTGSPSFEEVAVVAGWGSPQVFADFYHGISARYPVERVATRELAYQATAALQDRATELVRAAESKNCWDDGDYLLASANPRFVAIPENDLSPLERTTALEKIGRLSGPPGEHPSPEEALVRSYLPEIRATLRQVSEAPEEIVAAGTNFKEHDVPAAYRDGGKPDGAVLTAAYLESKAEWDLRGPYLSKNYGEGKLLTTFIKVGRRHAYLYKEVAALRTSKTANQAEREEER
jgi:hypothetical protein